VLLLGTGSFRGWAARVRANANRAGREAVDPAVREPGQRVLAGADHAEVQGIRQRGTDKRLLVLLGDEPVQAMLEAPDAAG
jgi:hypothetical protein